MGGVKVEELSVEGFLPFGRYANLIDPDVERIGAPPIEFFRDMVQMDLGGASMASFSTCRVEKRAPIIDVSEYHTATGEAILPLDNDVLIHVAPAAPPDAGLPLERVRVFRVPKGTIVILDAGVWHHAPLALNDRTANTLIVLPVRTYANDCTVVELRSDDQLGIDL